jgi:formamidopyrimidine-DNA glycosylase
MPELPEVEVVKKSLENNINDLIIKKVIINTNKLRYKINKKKLKETIGKKVISITRRSKYLLINFDKKVTLIVHLGMTGKFLILNKKKIIKKTSFYYQLKKKDIKHNHIIFIFKGNLRLIYNDVRKFGFIKLIKSDDINSNVHLKFLGPEPFSKNFNFLYFKKNIKNKKRTIKDLLMDQRFVSGLGNIYVNEVLFLSKIDPKRQCSKITTLEIKKIINLVRKILKESIRDGGSSIKDFSDGSGRSGVFQQQFNVYNKEGDKCVKKNCKELIKKTNISNRSTFYCKCCQK